MLAWWTVKMAVTTPGDKPVKYWYVDRFCNLLDLNHKFVSFSLRQDASSDKSQLLLAMKVLRLTSI